MDSKSFEQFGIFKWFELSEDSQAFVPRKRGTYVIRRSGGQRFGRLKGESDILYIGSTIARGGLRQRLGNYLSPIPRHWTDVRVNRLLEKYGMEVAWRVCDEPRNLEFTLHREYVRAHDELPPLNHARTKLQRKVLKEKIVFSDTVEVSKESRRNIQSPVRVEFTLETDVPTALAQRNYFKAIMICHDCLQMLLANLLSSAYSFLNDHQKSARYIKFDDYKYKKFKYPRMAKLIKDTRKLGLISPHEIIDIVKVKDFRNKATAHDTPFFDTQVLADDSLLKEVLVIKEISFRTSKGLANKITLITNAILSDGKRVLDGEDINEVLREHTLEKLIEVIKG